MLRTYATCASNQIMPEFITLCAFSLQPAHPGYHNAEKGKLAIFYMLRHIKM